MGQRPHVGPHNDQPEFPFLVLSLSIIQARLHHACLLHLRGQGVQCGFSRFSSDLEEEKNVLVLKGVSAKYLERFVLPTPGRGAGLCEGLPAPPGAPTGPSDYMIHA